MEFINTWQGFENPNLGTVTAFFVALALTLAMAWKVIKVAVRSKRFKPQSLLLLVVPALIVVTGMQVDNVREDQYRTEVTASGASDTGWTEIEQAVKRKYNVASVTPQGDPIDSINMAKEAAESDNVGFTPRPMVAVQMPDTTHVEVYVLDVQQTSSGVDVTLELQESMRLQNEGIDPERLLIDVDASSDAADI